jgi:hypothetical protein
MWYQPEISVANHNPLGILHDAPPPKTYGKSDFTPEVPPQTACQIEKKGGEID